MSQRPHNGNRISPEHLRGINIDAYAKSGKRGPAPMNLKKIERVRLMSDADVDEVLAGPEPTLRDALVGLSRGGSKEEMVSHVPPSMLQYLRFMQPGETGDMYFQKICAINGRKVDPDKASWFSLGRLRWDRPAATVQASHGIAAACQCCHPDADRRLTIPELRRVCAFPDDFQLTGPFHQRWERLGRSVPPLVSRAIGNAVGTRLISAR